MAKLLRLASKSPRRIELLEKLGFVFEVTPAVKDEIVPKNICTSDVVKEIAKCKAVEVYNKYPDDVIISADTIVVFNEKILGKPKDEQDAFRMLKMLSGGVHSVFTGVCIINNDDIDTFAEETKVEFYPLSDEEIARYIATGEPMDKAGAYGIQGKGSVLVKKIDGDYFNVMGLPVARVWRKLCAIDKCTIFSKDTL